MCADCFHIVSLFLSNPCTPSTLSMEAFVYFVCHTEIPQPPFAWKYYTHDVDAVNMQPALEQGGGKQTPSSGILFFVRISSCHMVLFQIIEGG